MDLQERLAQCRIDKASIETKEQELIEQIEVAERKQKIPFARSAECGWEIHKGESRLILHLTPEFVALVNERKGQVVSLGADYRGGVSVGCNTRDSDTPDANSLVHQYVNVQTLIE